MKPTLPVLAFSLALIGCGEDLLGPDASAIEVTARCDGGFADGFPCDGIDLVSQVLLTDLRPGQAVLAPASDIWGWTDPLTSTEYALVGRNDGLAIVDLSRPHEPRPIAFLAAAVAPSPWRDVKVYANHAYVVADGAPGHGIQILDLTRLRGLTEFTELAEDARYTGVSSVHNIAINEETGFAYSVGNNTGGDTCGGGLHMLDLTNPTSPSFVGCHAPAGTGLGGTGYTHDVQCVVYRGPDSAYLGREICIGSNENVIAVSDVTDKANPTTLASAGYPDFGYVHQGWLSEDHRFFFQNDEVDEVSGRVARTRLLVWDVTDLDDPVLATEHLGPNAAIDHNLYVRGDLAYHSNYNFGMRLLDVSNPANPQELGFFDTVPETDATLFGGSWSTYPFFDSGIVIVTSKNEGLFVLLVSG